MAVYERGNGAYTAEREQPAPGSDREKELERLAKDDASDWHRAGEPESDPKPAARKRAPAKPKGED
jgi:hypothetical protein